MICYRTTVAFLLGWACLGAVEAATVQLVASPTQSSYGQSVKFTAKVVDSTQATGLMTFSDGVNVLNTTVVTAGVASLTTRKLTGGSHLITATYEPTAGVATTASNELAFQVVVAASKTTISSTNLNVLNGKPGSVKAKVTAVSPGFGVPTGTVDFYLDDPVIPNPYPYMPYIPLDATGTALFDFSYFPGPGSYNVTAVYTGDTNFASSTSPMLVQTLLLNAPNAAVSYTPATVAVGASSTLTVSATNPTSSLMPSVALGVMPGGGSISVVSQPAGGSCRGTRVGGRFLYYCMLSLSASATKSLKLKVTTVAAGTFTSFGYARNTDSMDETDASATLTVQ